MTTPAIPNCCDQHYYPGVGSECFRPACPFKKFPNPKMKTTIASIESNMIGVRAVWIESNGTFVQLGRLACEANAILNSAGNRVTW